LIENLFSFPDFKENIDIKNQYIPLLASLIHPLQLTDWEIIGDIIGFS